jgi:hypothetical protein
LATSRLRRALQALWIVLGLILMAVGLVGLLLPTHLLGVFLVFGLILVLKNSMQWRRRFVRYQRRYPRIGHPLRRLLRNEVMPVLWQLGLRAERRLPEKWRRLKRARRRMMHTRRRVARSR